MLRTRLTSLNFSPLEFQSFSINKNQKRSMSSIPGIDFLVRCKQTARRVISAIGIESRSTSEASRAATGRSAGVTFEASTVAVPAMTPPLASSAASTILLTEKASMGCCNADTFKIKIHHSYGFGALGVLGFQGYLWGNLATSEFYENMSVAEGELAVLESFQQSGMSSLTTLERERVAKFIREAKNLLSNLRVQFIKHENSVMVKRFLRARFSIGPGPEALCVTRASEVRNCAKSLNKTIEESGFKSTAGAIWSDTLREKLFLDSGVYITHVSSMDTHYEDRFFMQGFTRKPKK